MVTIVAGAGAGGAVFWVSERSIEHVRGVCGTVQRLQF